MAPKPAHVLVVDDSVDTADSMADLLTLWGYDATACGSGGAALACARRHPPAAVLLDLAMPRMSGFQFLRLFRALAGCGAVPVVALTGRSAPEHVALARDVGIRHYLPKPADLAHLRALLGALTRRTGRPERRVPPGRPAGHVVRTTTGGWGRMV